MPIQTKKGFPSPLGAYACDGGVNFALFVQEPHNPLQLVIQDANTEEVITSLAVEYATGTIRHILVFGLPEAFIYSYLLDDHVLLDPFARKLAIKEPYVPKGFFKIDAPFDWGQDIRPNIPLEDLIIYEMHIRGFTQDPSSNVSAKGSYLGVIEKIPYLKKLGINAVELLPIHEFNPYEYHPQNKIYEGKLKQYWGYSSVNYFSPMSRYAFGDEPGAAVTEFKQMVRAFHEAGIEVILDVVYNHTAEGNKLGPIQSFKAFGEKTYYILDETGDFANYTGCGNTFNCNHPVSIELILHSLRYFVEEMHVDGFRFDLASIFYRGDHGQPLPGPPILDFITKDPILARVKLIAEPWDADGLYQVGNFFPESNRFSEWNARYRDTVRRFISGKGNLKGEFATRISGSSDLYNHHGGTPQKSINFVTSHDGFTLSDLVSYNTKHNVANGEYNKDGMNDNNSWNCGIEGKTDDPNILNLRERQMRNFHLALMLSQGIPMVHMGDEYGHTKLGNNNSWCQDNALNWFLWDKLEKNPDFYRFYEGLIHLRKTMPALRQKEFLKESNIHWHGKTPFNPAWDTDDHFIAFSLKPSGNSPELFAAFNAGPKKTTVIFPQSIKTTPWKWLIDTSRLKMYEEETIAGESYEMAPYSSLLLYS